jgi:ceramide glucosyltransferase
LPDRHFFVRIASLTIAAIPKLLLAAGLIGLLCSSIYCGLVLVAASSFARKRRSFLARGRDFFPKVSLLKPLYGDEPELESRLEGFFAQDYPSYEILFCARDHGDAGLRVARRVAQRYPHVPVQFLTTGAPAYTNAKVSSLELMGLAARSEILVISDSDVRVGPSYLREVAAPFADPIVGLVTCLYRGVSDGKSLWSKLEATAMSVEMAAGVLAAEWIEGMQFALGPTMAVRRSCVEEIGGFGTLGRYCADDFVLGRRIAANGHKVVLSHHVIDHIVLNESFSRSLQHQVRWMKSTRFSRPKGHFGTALTFSMPYGLLALGVAMGFHRPLLGVVLLLWSWGSRVALGALVGRLVVSEPKLLRSSLLYPLRDLLGFCYWVASYVSNQVRWRGEVYNLLQDGFMRNDPQTAEREPDAILTT